MGMVASLVSSFGLAEVSVGLLAETIGALFGTRLTKFGTDEKGDYYVPNIYLGLAVSALLIGRLAYRFLYTSVGQGFGNGGVATGQNPQAALQNAYDPLSGALLFISIGYYVIYWRAPPLPKRIEPEGRASS